MIYWRDVFLPFMYVSFTVYVLYVDAIGISKRNAIPNWQADDVAYPMRRYHSPPLGPLTEMRVDPNSARRTSPLTRSGETEPRACMRRRIDTLMDRLLSIRRVDFNANPGHYKE